MLSRNQAFSSGAATVAIATFLAFAPAAFAAEPEVDALQKEVDGLQAKVALLERQVIELGELAGVVPAKLPALEGKGAVERFDLLRTEPEQPERQAFGKL